MRRQIAYLSALVLLALLLNGCFVAGQSQVGPKLSITIEDAVQRANGCIAPLNDLQIRSIRSLPKGSIVLYTGVCPPDPGLPRAIHFFGYAILERQQGLWFPGAGNAVNIKQMPPDQLIEFHRAGGSESAVLFGRTLHPRVTAVEVTLDNGMVVRDPVQNGVFAIVTDGTAKAHELRILGEDGKVLQSQVLP